MIPPPAAIPFPLLEVTDLRCSLSGTEILKGVSFAMRPGEARALIGPNGAGKSTLARCIAGLATASGGGVRLEGRDLSALSRRELAKIACYLPQASGGLPGFHVLDFVLMGRYAHRGFREAAARDDREAAERAMALAGIAHLAERSVATLSGGEMRLVSIAACLAQEAKLLILDEPASFLDPSRRESLLALLMRLNREEGLSILLVTHDVNVAMLFAHGILAIREGKTLYDGPPDGLRDGAVLQKIFSIPFACVPIGQTSRRLGITPGLAGDAWPREEGTEA